MPRDDLQFQSAKRAYKQASIEGNRQEEARWANVVGDILKRRGEYVEALRWLRRDYEVSMKYLPEKQLLPTCQSLGEVYLRLQQFKDALIYQKKHLELAKDKDDLIEQQRASTQLGRTYHEMFSISESDHYAVRNAKKYFKLAMELTRTLKENPQHYKSSFTKEFIDAHNNLGMLEMDLDNLDEAEKILLEGLKICDEEEVNQDDDARSRLHHNLGSLYIELRAWDKAKEHIERDIIICNRIGHLQGEAKGYINLGELHYRVQKYDEAKLCYRKALDIARCMEDEDALVDQINQNIETVKEAGKVLEDLKIEEQRLKKLSRRTALAKGKPGERRCLLDQNASLDCLIEKASMVFAWLKHHEYAKRKKRVASDLCDKEKLSDSFLVIGESYQKLRNFDKARKWYVKSWNMYKLIGNLEGQALTKINIGAVLDSGGDWAGALKAFEEGYRLAVEGNLPSVQVSALDNMHYSHMIRFDNIEEARKLQQEIQDLKSSLNQDAMLRNRASECCSETATEGGNISDNASDSCNYPTIATLNPLPSDKELSDDVLLVSLIDKNKKLSNKRMSTVDSHGGKTCESSKATVSCSDINNPQLVGRKRVRVVLSDDEIDETNHPSRRPQNLPLKGSVLYGKSRDALIGRFSKIEDGSHGVEPKDGLSAFTQSNPEESSCSYKSVCPEYTAENSMEFRSSNHGDMAHASLGAASASRTDGRLVSNIKQQSGNIATSHPGTCEGALQCKVTFKIGDDTISVDLRSCVIGDEISIEAMKAELACLYYLQLSEERRSKGVLPIVKKLRCGEKALGSFEPVEDFKEYVSGKGCIEVPIDGWVHNRLIKLYIDYCKKLSEPPNMKLLKRLYSLEFSEDEVILSDCELQDMSISPFLDALQEHNTISVLDISHNLLGNGTMEKLQQIFASSSQKYGSLTLDFHCNRFGPAALFQICECPVLFARLEVLNLSENRLTDACSSYLSTILRNCETLYSLKIEHCSITSRTIQKVADALEAGSVLSELSIGRNNPISGPAMVSLLTKLATLKRFSELNLNGVTLSKPVVDSLCRLSKSSSLSGLMLGSTNIGADGLVQLIQALSCGPGELVKLDISHCGLTSPGFMRMCTDMVSLASLLELNLGRNSIGEEGCRGLISLLTNPQCCLKVLMLNKCQLGLTGIIQIIHALTENDSLEELNLAENTGVGQVSRWQHHITHLAITRPSQICAPEGVETSQQGLNLLASDVNSLEVADSEDNSIREAPTVSDLKDDCASSGQRSGFEECQLFQELSVAIGMAKQLQSLDLSNNGFSVKVAETFYLAWCSSSRCGDLSQKHITEKIIHFSMEGKKCCGVKLCCRRE